MLFFDPMWHSDTEREGKWRCTPLGYSLHIASEVIGWTGLITLLAVGATLARMALGGGFRWALVWLLLAPLAIGVLSEFLFRYSWALAARKGFRYDPERYEASWIEDGRRVTFRENS